jgi:hypothetical protein
MIIIVIINIIIGDCMKWKLEEPGCVLLTGGITIGEWVSASVRTAAG